MERKNGGDGGRLLTPAESSTCEMKASMPKCITETKARKIILSGANEKEIIPMTVIRRNKNQTKIIRIFILLSKLGRLFPRPQYRLAERVLLCRKRVTASRRE